MTCMCSQHGLMKETVVLCWILLGHRVISHLALWHAGGFVESSISSGFLQNTSIPAVGEHQLAALFKRKKKNQLYDG